MSAVETPLPTRTAQTPLVDVEFARQHLDDPKVRFIEVDVDTSTYDTGHLPGAAAFNWTTQLTDSVKRDLVSREELEALLRAAGINDDTLIVLYGVPSLAMMLTGGLAYLRSVQAAQPFEAADTSVMEVPPAELPRQTPTPALPPPVAPPPPADGGADALPTPVGG